ncbi:MAG: Nif3-like dinuclear metal center hexameric protein [Gemmatimonadota bacterium]|nr:Nif3-like dinuclear metal center hexameric protein [Gemmatimonadota bacterium]
MAALTEIIAELDRLLEPGGFSDYGPNGVQVPGSEWVETVATGVSAHAELFELARRAGAQMVLTHHGLLWEGAPLAITRTQARRLKVLLDNDMTLASYHLPLDAHQELGNNALIAKGLLCDAWQPFGDHRGCAIGCAGRFGDDGVAADELVARVRALTQREPLVFAEGPPQVRSVGIVSGGGAGHLDEAIEAGLDAFLTGEPTERVMAQAREAGIHFIAAGHYATETFGVRALGDHLAERFDVRHVFLDVPNPI